MQDNIFWDKKINNDEIKKILRDELHPRFIEFAALFLSRTNKTKEVFAKYLDKIIFCRNWRKIKKEMRINKWSDNRIIFWDAVYQATIKKIDKSKLRISKRKQSPINPELQKIGNIIRTTRKKKGWTQKKLAMNIGLSQQIISFVERGYRTVSVGTLIKITDALNIKVSFKPIEDKATSIGTATDTYSDL